MLVEIIRLSVNKGDVSARYSSGWTSETVVNAHLQSADIEIVEVIIESCISVGCSQVCVFIGSETLAKEISDMTKYDEHQITDVSCQEVV
jgi:hypothetical protein